MGLALVAVATLILVNNAVLVLIKRESLEFYGWRALVLKLAVTGIGTVTGFWVGRIAFHWRVSIPFIVGLAAFWVFNWWDCAYPTSFDMNARCGIPFHRWQDGNFAGYGAGILRAGLVGDLVVGFGIAAAGHWIAAAVASRRFPKQLQPTSGATSRS